MKVAIITVNFNGKQDTLDLLQSLSKLLTTNYQLLTIVVDNASEDGLVGELVKDYPEVVVLQNGVNKGFAGGYNRGIYYALADGADYVLVINNDCVIKDADLLDELIKTAKSSPKIGIVSPKIYFAPGYEFHKDRYQKSDSGKVIWYGGGSFDWNNIQGVHRGIDEVDSGKYDEKEKTDFVSGACMLIKKEVFEKVGLFNEDYFLYFEDVEFQKRLSEDGFNSYYNGKVALYHKVSQSTTAGSSLTDYYLTRNRLIFGMKYAGFKTKFALVRQAFWQLLFGRTAQRKGILDFTFGETREKRYVGEIGYPVKLSICIVSYNTADLTKKLLESIFKYQKSLNLEVIVGDNGSDDNCKEVIKEYLSKINFFQNKENTGFTRGYNKAICLSRGKHILLLNSDVEVLENSLQELVKYADQYKGKAVLGGKLFFPDHTKQDSVFHLPTLSGAFKQYFLAKKGAYFMYLPDRQAGQPDSDKPVKVEGFVMACFLIPRLILNKAGMLDEGTFIYFEDLEYCRRLKKMGVPLYFIPTAEFIHHHGASSKTIGMDRSQELLEKAARHYHGEFYYFLISLVLRIGQKLGRVKTPTSRWQD